MLRYWWVNQNQTYQQEVGGGYMWSPKTNSNGASNHFYDNMTRVAPGDVVLSFARRQIRAAGIVQGVATSAPKPTTFGTAGEYWGNEAWLVPVQFKELATPIRPKDHISLLRPTLPLKYSPLRNTGDGLQSVYLAEVPNAMANALRSLIGEELERIVAAIDDAGIEELRDDIVERTILGRTDIAATQKQQLTNARRGQGLYRARLEQQEKGCRVTGVILPAFLRASHAKPWRDSTDDEKLDGANGLLLSPHVDHLFDRGYISFADNGQILVSPRLPPGLAERWNL